MTGLKTHKHSQNGNALLYLNARNIKSHLMQSTRFWLTVCRSKPKIAEAVEQTSRHSRKKKIEHTERTILENEIIYVLICFEQSAQILLGHTKRWWCIQRWRWRENWPQLHQRQANTHQSHVCTCVLLVCVVTRSIYMAPNHKRENQIKSIIKSVLGHSPYAFKPY